MRREGLVAVAGGKEESTKARRSTLTFIINGLSIEGLFSPFWKRGGGGGALRAPALFLSAKFDPFAALGVIINGLEVIIEG